MKQTRILVVDDHRVVIEGIKSALRDQPGMEVVGEALNGRKAVKMAEILRPDIVIMDISMSDLNGIDSTLQIRKIDSGIGIIVFTMYSDREYVTDLFDAGISAYVLKEDPLSDLIKAIREVSEGRNYFHACMQEIISEHLRAREAGKKDSRKVIERLSLREREVFQLLAEGRTIRKIATELNLSPKTVETHKYNIMGKLNVSSLSDLTKVAIRMKLIQP